MFENMKSKRMNLLNTRIDYKLAKHNLEEIKRDMTTIIEWEDKGCFSFCGEAGIVTKCHNFEGCVIYGCKNFYKKISYERALANCQLKKGAYKHAMDEYIKFLLGKSNR